MASHCTQQNISDPFVSIDVRNLLMPQESEDDDSSQNPKSLQTTLLRKGSMQRGGGGDTLAAPAHGGTSTPTTITGGTCDNLSFVIHVAGKQEPASVERVSTPTAVGARSRRFGKRQALRLDPKRVLLLFASMSSMGTLVLLYFILSMGKTGDAVTETP